MTTYDFSKLTPAQRSVLTYKGWTIGCGRVQPGKSTVAKLIARGLVTRVETKVGGAAGTMIVDEYDVSFEVHIAWCAHCSRRAA